MQRKPVALIMSVIVGASLAAAVQSSEAFAAACPAPIPAVAHRGGSEVHAENTLRAFQQARTLGVTAWETDVRFTADGERVLMHDSAVDRTTTGSGQVSATDSGTLRSNLRTRDGQVVPTLRELLVLAYASQARVLIDIKVDPTPEQWSAVAADLDAYAMRPSVVLTSFSGSVVLEAQQAIPGVQTGLIAGRGYVPVADLTQYGKSYVKFHDSVTAARLDEWSGPLDVYAYTVDTADAWARMQRYSAEPGRLDGVITNKPRAYLAWAAARTC